MAEYLVIGLSADDSPQATWVVADSSTERASLPESGALDDAARLAGERPVIVLVPGEAVFVSRVNLPVRGTARMLQAVPYALEEQLAEDIGDMHFAIGRRGGDGQVPVAAVRRDRMSRWLEALDQAGVTVAAMYPDVCCVPQHSGITIMLDGNRALIRDAQGRVMAGEAEIVGALVQAAGATPDTDSGPARLYVSDSDAAQLEQPLRELRIVLPELEITPLRHSALPVLANTALSGNPQPNLLQGDFMIAGDGQRYWQAWRGAAVLGGIVVLTALGVKAAEVMTLKSELRELNQQINQVAVESMPPGSRIVEPVAQLEQRARELRGAGGGSDHGFLEMLGALTSALDDSQTQIGQLDYRGGTMDLTLDAPDVDTLERIRSGVERGGTLEARIESGTRREDRVQGRLRIMRRQS